MNIFSEIPHTRTIRQTVEGFIRAWQDGDYEKALTYTQKTWRDHADKTPTHLETVLGGHSTGEVINVVITQEHEMMADIRVKLLIGDDEESVLQMRLIREKAPFKPDKRGEWGINPASIRSV